jgi:hypothetical protein
MQPYNSRFKGTTVSFSAIMADAANQYERKMRWRRFWRKTRNWCLLGLGLVFVIIIFQ